MYIINYSCAECDMTPIWCTRIKVHASTIYQIGCTPLNADTAKSASWHSCMHVHVRAGRRWPDKWTVESTTNWRDIIAMKSCRSLYKQRPVQRSIRKDLGATTVIDGSYYVERTTHYRFGPHRLPIFNCTQDWTPSDRMSPKKGKQNNVCRDLSISASNGEAVWGEYIDNCRHRLCMYVGYWRALPTAAPSGSWHMQNLSAHVSHRVSVEAFHLLCMYGGWVVSGSYSIFGTDQACDWSFAHTCNSVRI